MTLSTKQRAKVNAALCIIHDSGADAQAVTAAAHAIIAEGHPATYAYESVLNGFAAQNPELGATIGKVTRLIHESSPESIAQYDHALTEYISTGNDAAMVALAPMVAADSVALAIRNGETTEAEIASSGFASVLGGEPTPAMQFAFAAATMAAPAAADGASQISAVEGPGMVAPKAQLVHAHYSGFATDTPVLNGLTPVAAREAARADAAGHGRRSLTRARQHDLAADVRLQRRRSRAAAG